MLLFNGSRFNQLNTFGLRRGAFPLPREQTELFQPFYANRMAFGYASSFPKGYQTALAIWPVFFSNEVKIKVRMAGGSDIAVTSQAITKQAAALVGAAALTVLGVEAHVRSAALVGSSAIAVDGKSAASIMVDLNCGAIPTAQDVAQATMQMTVEAGISLQEVLRLLLAVAAGEATGLDTNPAFKSADGSKTRVAGTRSGGTRTITTRDGT